MELLSNTGILIEDLFGIDGFDVYWYGFLITCAFLLAFFVVSFFANRRGHYKDLTLDMLIVTVIGAIVGARLYYVIFEWESYYVKGNFLATLSNVVDIRKGGLAIYGGIILCVIGLTVFAFIKKIKPIQLLDLCAPALSLGQAIGRWGNFFNQEAHGLPVEGRAWQFFPYAVYIDDPKGGEPVGWYQATFFYESMWCLLIFGVLLYIFFRQKYYGQITLTYLALYGFERGIIEWLRTDQLKVFGVPVSAILSIVLFVGATTLLIIFAVKKRRDDIPYIKKGQNKEKKDA